jgi:hypothetical protein
MKDERSVHPMSENSVFFLTGTVYWVNLNALRNQISTLQPSNIQFSNL